MQARRVHVIAAGGTIAMSGSPALPRDDPSVVGAAPVGDHHSVEVFAQKPSVHFSAAEALSLARRATAVAHAGSGVVVTAGTDCLEEFALLCDLLYDGAAPIVFTGAIRPASAAGADGPANLRDAWAVAAAYGTSDLGVLLSFGGQVHSATTVRKCDSDSPAAFASPLTGPLGYVNEGRVRIHTRPPRRPAMAVHNMDACVEIVQVGLGSTAALLEATSDLLDGLVVVLPGAGHAPPQVLYTLRWLCHRIPVVITVRPTRGTILRETYGFEGSEADVRSTGAICAAGLSPAGARMKLIACLGGSGSLADIGSAFEVDDV